MTEQKKKIHIKLVDFGMDGSSEYFANHYGTHTYVNGERLRLINMDRATILEQVLEHLGYTVEVEDENS